MDGQMNKWMDEQVTEWWMDGLNDEWICYRRANRYNTLGCSEAKWGIVAGYKLETNSISEYFYCISLPPTVIWIQPFHSKYKSQLMI